MKTFEKDPDAILDYVFDWTEWLGDDQITVVTLIVPEDLTLVNTQVIGAKVVVSWIEGGVDGKSYELTCRVQTFEGRKEDRTMIFIVKDR